MRKLFIILSVFAIFVVVFFVSSMKASAQKPIIEVGPLCMECDDAMCEVPEIPGVAAAESYENFIKR